MAEKTSTQYIFMKRKDVNMRCETDDFYFDIMSIASNLPKEETYSQDTLHRHPYYELNIVTNGECEFELKNKKRLTVKKGQFILFPVNYRHRIVLEGPGFQKTAIAYKLTIKENGNSDFFKFADSVIENIKAYRYTKGIKQLQERIVSLFQEKSYEYSTAILHTSLNIVLDALNIAVGPREISKKEIFADERVNTAIKYINDNIYKDLSVSEVADALHISSKQFTRIFKKATEMTPGNFIKNRRLEKMRELLNNLSLSLEDIAEIMNFGDLSSFIKVFKRAEGITPGKSRAKYFEM